MRRSLVVVVAVAALAAGVAAALALGAPRWREWRLRRAPGPVDVVVVTLDTTRADRLGAYTSGLSTSPVFDALARRGVTFRQAWSHVPLTFPAHASMFTGVTPARHGVHDNGGYVLGPDLTTLGERLVDAGYRTGAFVSAFVLDRRFGLARGFGTYEDDVLQGGRDDILASVRSDVVVSRAAAWLALDQERPIFLWAHFYDAHHPYDPPEPFKSRFDRPYDGEIAYADAQLGRLLEEVGKRGRPTLVAVLADHGEALGEHGEVTHSYYIYSGTQHVPFVLSLPGFLPEGRSVDAVVRIMDLMPTILDIVGLPPQPDVEARSLVPLLTGRSSEEAGPAYLESYHPRLWWGARELLGLRTGPWLYIRSPDPELYRLDEDPKETRNLAAQETALRERLDARLTAIVGTGDPMAGRSDLDPEAEARLRALGYVGGVPTSVDAALLPDAKSNGALLAGVSRGNDLAAEGKHEEALAAYQETLRLNPRSQAVRSFMGGVLMKLQRFEEAFQLYAELSLEDPKNEGFPTRMAHARAAQGRLAEAEKVLRDSLVSFPRSARMHEDLGALLLQTGRIEEARVQLATAVEISPRSLAARLRHGFALARLRRLDEAAVELRAVVDVSPSSKEAERAGDLLVPIAGDLLGRGELEAARRAYLAALSTAAKAEEAAYMNLALASYRLGRRSEALEVLGKGVAAHPKSVLVRYRYGRVLQSAGRTDEAERAFREALEIEPGHAESRAALESMRAGAPAAAAGRPAAAPAR